MTRPTLTAPGDLGGFPSVRPPAVLVRICRHERSPWYFSADGAGRFDLKPPEGTCYFATDAYAAIREASRLGPVTPGWLAARRIFEIEPPGRYRRLAATHTKAAGRYGLTTELVTILPYDLPRRWAAALREAGFDGLRHQLRHDARARASGVSLFGPAGAGAYAAGPGRPLDAEAARAAGIAVYEPPHSSVLSVVP